MLLIYGQAHLQCGSQCLLSHPSLMDIAEADLTVLVHFILLSLLPCRLNLVLAHGSEWTSDVESS